jgi:hypothetical protein
MHTLEPGAEGRVKNSSTITILMHKNTNKLLYKNQYKIQDTKNLFIKINLAAHGVPQRLSIGP